MTNVGVFTREKTKAGLPVDTYLRLLEYNAPEVATIYRTEGRTGRIRSLARKLARVTGRPIFLYLVKDYSFYPTVDGRVLIAWRRRMEEAGAPFELGPLDLAYPIDEKVLTKKLGYTVTLTRLLLCLAAGYKLIGTERRKFLVPNASYEDDPSKDEMSKLFDDAVSPGFQKVNFYPATTHGLVNQEGRSSKDPNMEDAYLEWSRALDPPLWAKFDAYPHPVCDVPSFGMGGSKADLVYDGPPLNDDEALVRLYREAMYQTQGPDFKYDYVTPMVYFKFSFITGSSVSGLRRVVEKFKHGTDGFGPTSHLLACAYLYEMGINIPQVKLQCSTMNVSDLRDVNYKELNSAGIMHNKAGVINNGNHVIRQVTSCPKAGALQAALAEHEDVEARLRVSGSLHYSGAIKRKEVVALFVKPEIADPSRDPDKVRLIFMCTMHKFLVDTVIYGPCAQQLFLKRGVLIGWSKTAGGMQFLYDDLKRDWSRHFVLEADFSSLDFTERAQLLSLILFFPAFFYDTQSEMWPKLLWFLEWSVDTGTSKYLQAMAKKVYMVIGQMFSGEFYTSIGDTLYVKIAIRAWHIWVFFDLMRRGLEEEAAHWRIYSDYVWVYGDDTIASFPWYAYVYVTGVEWEDRSKDDKPVQLDKWMNERLGLKLKMTDCYVFFACAQNGYDPLISVPDREGGLAWRGPKILQRHFIRIDANYDILMRTNRFKSRDGQLLSVDGGEVIYRDAIVPYRPLTAYYTRGCMSVNDPSLLGLIAKLRGLAYDTAGTNLVAYRFLLHLHDRLCVAWSKENGGGSVDLAVETLLTSKGADAISRMNVGNFELRQLFKGYPKHALVLAAHLPNTDRLKKFRSGYYVNTKATYGHVAAATRNWSLPFGA